MHDKRILYRFIVVIRHDMILHANLASLVLLKNQTADGNIMFPYDSTCVWTLQGGRVLGRCHGSCVPDQLQVIPGHLVECFLSFLRWTSQEQKSSPWGPSPWPGGFPSEYMYNAWSQWRRGTQAFQAFHGIFLVEHDACRCEGSSMSNRLWSVFHPHTEKENSNKASL